MRVSFIIPLYNCLPLTQAMLASLRATLPAGLAHEIIFVDDGSSDGTREWLRATFPNPTPAADSPVHVLLNERNLGYAGANNRASGFARGEFLVLLNNDLVLLPRWLEPMLAAHASFPGRAGLIGNVQLDAKSGTIDHAGIVINQTGKPWHLRARPPRLPTFFRRIYEVPAVTGACLLIERALWQKLGGFDEAFTNGGEDIDLCFQARAAGRVNAVALDSVVRHHVSASPGRKLRDEENSRRLVQRWQREFIAAASHGTRDWCRTYLARALAEPRAAEYRLALSAMLYAAYLRRDPPAEAIRGVAAGQAQEFARWNAMFGT